MKYGIVYFPSKSVQDFANSYRKRYDTHYALISPHLTLKNAFEATNEEIRDITKQLRRIAENTEPITITITKFSSFTPVNNVLYLKVEPTDEIKALNEALNSGDLVSETEYAFVPHITIGQQMSDAEHADVYGQLKMQEVNFTETIDRFHLLYQLENGSWTVYETFRLGKDE